MEKPPVLIALEQLLIQNHITYEFDEDTSLTALDLNIELIDQKGGTPIIEINKFVEFECAHELHNSHLKTIGFGLFRTNQLQLIIDLLIARSW